MNSAKYHLTQLRSKDRCILYICTDKYIIYKTRHFVHYGGQLNIVMVNAVIHREKNLACLYTKLKLVSLAYLKAWKQGASAGTALSVNKKPSKHVKMFCHDMFYQLCLNT